MSDGPKLFVKVCEKCGRQVEPHVDHRLGTSLRIRCSHGKVRGTEEVRWKKIEVTPLTQPDTEQGEEEAAALEAAYGVDEFLRTVLSWEGSAEDELSAAIEDNERVIAALHPADKENPSA